MFNRENGQRKDGTMPQLNYFLQILLKWTAITSPATVALERGKLDLPLVSRHLWYFSIEVNVISKI